MKVLLLSQFFSDTKGGGEYVFKTMAKILVKKNHNVWVITHKIKDEIYPNIPNLEIITVKPILEYKGGLPPSFLDNIKYVINTFLQARKILKKEKIEIIHSNNFSPALVGSLLSLFYKIPHITTIHDIFSDSQKNFWKEWSKQSEVSEINAMLVPWFEKFLLKLKIDCIHSVSETTKRDIQKLGCKKPIVIIPNCIQEEKSVETLQKNKQFLYVGRLVFYKNLEVVFKAFKIVIKKYPDSHLVIAGDGPHKAVLKDLSESLDIKKNVSFKGFVTTDEKKKLLAESNSLLFPSMVEGFGLVILEAFEQKRTVLAANLGPMNEIIENDVTGCLLDPNDPEKWSETIIRLIENQEEAKKMGKNGFEILRKRYSQEKFYEKLMNMYNEFKL